MRGCLYKALIGLPLALALAYVTICLLLYLFQAKLIFPASGPSSRTPTASGFAQFEAIQLSVGKETSEAWYLPHDNPRGTVLFSHGNGETMAERLEMAKAFHDLGFDVFLYEYGGYARSTGSPSEARCYSDINAAWQYLVETRKIAPEQILVFGESMGTGPSVDLASRVTPGALVLLSPFTSLADIAKSMLPYFPVDLLLCNRFDNLAKMSGVHAPVLILHGRDDTIVPFMQGKKLFRAANEPKTFVELPDGHGAFYAAPDAFTKAISEFVARIFPPKT